jgi:hypothetical protein
MRRQLVFIHGRSQEKKDAADLKQQWIAAFRKGLEKNGLQLPIPESDIRFPYYGQTLYDLVSDVAPDQVAEVVVKGARSDRLASAFVEAALKEVMKREGITDAEVMSMAGTEVIERGIQNKKWVLSILRAIDKHVPGGSAASVAAVTNDVYQYLRNPGVRDQIDSGVRAAFAEEVPKVVVSHSLGTVVAYNILGREGSNEGWEVPLFITLGSPLAITVIRDALAPIKTPKCAGKWVNAFDKRDVVSLYPLDSARFNVKPPIENLAHVSNHTDNRHGIAGYLDDKEVARRIHEALVA